MADENLETASNDLSELIDLDRLTQFGRGTIVPIEETIVSQSNAISALDTEVDSLEGSIANTEKSPAESAHATGSYLYYNGVFYKVTSEIAVGDTLTVGTNIEATTVGVELQSGGGGTNDLGLSVINGQIYATYTE